MQFQLLLAIVGILSVIIGDGVFAVPILRPSADIVAPSGLPVPSRLLVPSGLLVPALHNHTITDAVQTLEKRKSKSYEKELEAMLSNVILTELPEKEQKEIAKESKQKKKAALIEKYTNKKIEEALADLPEKNKKEILSEIPNSKEMKAFLKKYPMFKKAAKSMPKSKSKARKCEDKDDEEERKKCEQKALATKIAPPASIGGSFLLAAGLYKMNAFFQPKEWFKPKFDPPVDVSGAVRGANWIAGTALEMQAHSLTQLGKSAADLAGGIVKTGAKVTDKATKDLVNGLKSIAGAIANTPGEVVQKTSAFFGYSTASLTDVAEGVGSGIGLVVTTSTSTLESVIDSGVDIAAGAVKTGSKVTKELVKTLQNIGEGVKDVAGSIVSTAVDVGRSLTCTLLDIGCKSDKPKAEKKKKEDEKKKKDEEKKKKKEEKKKKKEEEEKKKREKKEKEEEEEKRKEKADKERERKEKEEEEKRKEEEEEKERKRKEKQEKEWEKKRKEEEEKERKRNEEHERQAEEYRKQKKKEKEEQARKLKEAEKERKHRENKELKKEEGEAKRRHDREIERQAKANKDEIKPRDSKFSKKDAKRLEKQWRKYSESKSTRQSFNRVAQFYNGEGVLKVKGYRQEWLKMVRKEASFTASPKPYSSQLQPTHGDLYKTKMRQRTLADLDLARMWRLDYTNPVIDIGNEFEMMRSEGFQQWRHEANAFRDEAREALKKGGSKFAASARDTVEIKAHIQTLDLLEKLGDGLGISKPGKPFVTQGYEWERYMRKVTKEARRLQKYKPKKQHCCWFCKEELCFD